MRTTNERQVFLGGWPAFVFSCRHYHN
jgi:hypothetical protein